MNTLLIASSLVMKPIFPVNLPLEEKIKAFRPYFYPPPGETVRAEHDHTIQKKEQPWSIKGFITIKPPQGSCFVVQRHPSRLDLNICEPQNVAFSLDEIDESGQIRWLVFQSQQDPGTELTWQTPYRQARIIGLGDFETGNEKIVTIKSCKAEVTAFQRKISISLMNGIRWTILYPDKDQPIKYASHRANLYVRVLKPSPAGGLTLDREYHSWGEKGRDPSIPPPPKKITGLAAKLSGHYKKKKDEDYKFGLDKPGTFTMSSSNFLENNAPKGLNGQCRYRYQDAPGDPESGVIECFNTEAYDALYTHIPCSKDLVRKILEVEADE